jgi:hypothetical protein
MPAGQVEIDDRVGDVPMAEQNLNGPQIGAGLQHVRRETVAQRVRRDVLLDASSCPCLDDRILDHLRGDGLIGAPAVHRTGEQIGLRFHPPPIPSQGLEQLGAEKDIAVSRSLALTDADDHALTVNVCDLQMAQLRAAQSGRIQSHQHGAVHEVFRRRDQPLNLLRTEDRGQRPRPLRKRNMFVEIGTPQCLHIQEAKSCRLSLDRARQQLAITKQVGLVLPDVVRTKPVGRATEVPGELFHCAYIAAHRTERIVAALEFIQHHLTESGHSDLLVTQKLSQPTNYSTATEVAAAAQRLSSNGLCDGDPLPRPRHEIPVAMPTFEE